MEEEIADLESAQSERETQMSDPDFYKDGDKAQAVLSDYEASKLKLERIYEEWSALSDQLAALDQ